MMNKLTPKQKKFCEYYIQTCNAAEAARLAGYSEKSAKEVGSENLTKPNIRAYIDSFMAKQDSARVADVQEILEYLTKVVRGEIKDQLGFDASISDRSKAAETLLKVNRAFDKDQNTTSSNVTIVDDIGSGKDED